MAATTPTLPSGSETVRWTRPRHRTLTGPARVISWGRVKRISTGEPYVTSFGRKKNTARELTSLDSVRALQMAEPVVHRTVSGNLIWNRWVLRRSLPGKGKPPE